VRVRIDPRGTFLLDWLLAALLLASRIWWDRTGHRRIADACGTVALVSLGGMACGAIAMLELRLGFPLADAALLRLDHTIGVDGIGIVQALVRMGHWVFWIMAPAYNFAIPIFFAGLVILSWIGDRMEAWRAAFCFVGTLFTTCLIAAVAPAKGLGVWAPPALLDQLPDQAMRTFWPNFDNFYSGGDPVLRMHVIDGVISFPSFHSVVGFLVLAMWRKKTATLVAAGLWLAVMMVATLPGGGHYVVDLIAGFAVWAAWFGISRRVEGATVAAHSDNIPANAVGT
jgi:membrane-associated phospholipid phosphatase